MTDGATSPPSENVPAGAALIVLAFLLVAIMSALGGLSLYRYYRFLSELD